MGARAVKIIGSAAVVLVAGVGVGAVVGLVWQDRNPEPVDEPTVVELEERFIQLEFEEGAQARREEGKVARKDAKLSRPAHNRVQVQKQQLDKQIAEDAGVLGHVQEGSGSALGTGGLGTRGTGLGGGGTADGLGGLGTTGLGTGASGYGRGGGSFGSVNPGGLVGIGPASVTTLAPAPSIVNDVVNTDRDRFSTFAIDVDTGSYTLTRRTLRSGALPTPAGVRVEEFVNFFDYNLDPPTSGKTPFALGAEAAPSPVHTNHHLLRVALKGMEVDVDEVPARITLLVDTSCSMSGPRLAQVKDALTVLVDHAGPEDSFAIATYAGSTRQVLAPTPASQRARLHGAIDDLSTGGGTAMGSGMELAYKMARQHYLKGGENRVIVLSDGDANIGQTSHAGILKSIEQHAGEGITLSTVGFGTGNYRDAMMEQLADKGDGNYVYIDGPDEARRVFGEGFAAMTRTIARDVKIQVEFDPEAVLAWRLVGYENRDVADEDFRVDAVDGGEIGSGHEVTALYDVVLADRLPDTIASVHLRAKEPGPDQPAREWTLPITRSQVRAEWGDVTADMRLVTAAALFAEKLRQSPFVEEVQWADLRRIAAPLLPTPQVQELRELMQQAERLESGGTVARGRTLGEQHRYVVDRHQNQLTYCYQREAMKRPGLKGDLEMTLFIGADGSVVKVHKARDTLRSQPVASCVEGRMRRMRFPAGVATSMQVPLTFGG